MFWNPNATQGILKFWDEKEIKKHLSRAKSQRAPSFVDISKDLSLHTWRLGAKNFFETVLSNIRKVRC